MALIQPLRGFIPKISDDVFIAENATIIGDVTIHSRCSIWYQAVIRGDVSSIEIGVDSNVQDGVVIHGTYLKSKTKIGDRVTIGHRAIIHGCTIEDEVLIGMGAIIMDNAHIGRNSIIGAGSVVLANTIVPPGTLFGGVPAKELKKLSPDEQSKIIEYSEHYKTYTTWYKSEGTFKGGTVT